MKCVSDKTPHVDKTVCTDKKVQLLEMLKEGRTYTAVGHHYVIHESSVCYIKEEERRKGT